MSQKKLCCCSCWLGIKFKKCSKWKKWYLICSIGTNNDCQQNVPNWTQNITKRTKIFINENCSKLNRSSNENNERYWVQNIYCCSSRPCDLLSYKAFYGLLWQNIIFSRGHRSEFIMSYYVFLLNLHKKGQIERIFCSNF